MTRWDVKHLAQRYRVLLFDRLKRRLPARFSSTACGQLEKKSPHFQTFLCSTISSPVGSHSLLLTVDKMEWPTLCCQRTERDCFAYKGKQITISRDDEMSGRASGVSDLLLRVETADFRRSRSTHTLPPSPQVASQWRGAKTSSSVEADLGQTF